MTWRQYMEGAQLSEQEKARIERLTEAEERVLDNLVSRMNKRGHLQASFIPQKAGPSVQSVPFRNSDYQSAIRAAITGFDRPEHALADPSAYRQQDETLPPGVEKAINDYSQATRALWDNQAAAKVCVKEIEKFDGMLKAQEKNIPRQLERGFIDEARQQEKLDEARRSHLESTTAVLEKMGTLREEQQYLEQMQDLSAKDLTDYGHEEKLADVERQLEREREHERERD